MYMKPHLIALAQRGLKTHTRRILKPGERVENGVWYTAAGRVKYREGQDYPLCPRRGQKQVDRINVLKLRAHPLRDMTTEDILMEGIQPRYFQYSEVLLMHGAILREWIDLWNAINTRKGTHWESNPLVVDVTFEMHRPQHQSQLDGLAAPEV